MSSRFLRDIPKNGYEEELIYICVEKFLSMLACYMKVLKNPQFAIVV